MTILFLLVAILLFNWCAGFVTVVVLQTAFPISLYRVRAIRLTLPIIGYASANLLWWIGAILLGLPSGIVVYTASAFVLLSLLLVRFRFSKRHFLSLLPAKCDWPLLLGLLCVLAMAAWPYIAVGMRNYFLVNETDYFLRVTPSILHNHTVSQDFLHSTTNAAYLRDKFPIQISSLMLLQFLLGCSGTDSAVLQAIINLVYTALGTYWLSRYMLHISVRLSVVGAFLSVVAQFYFHTYLDGHIGSIIYASAAPFFFGLSIYCLARDRYRTTLLVILELGLLMSKAYPLVVYLLFPSFLLAKAYWLYRDHRHALIEWLQRTRTLQRLTERALLYLAAISFLLASLPAAHFISRLFYPNRVSVIFNGYQPMFIVFDPRVFSWFYGLRLTEGFGYGVIDPSYGRILGIYDGFATLLTVILTIAAAAAAWYYRYARVGSFFSCFVLLFPLMALAFAWVWPFSYLIYKALYVHYFLIAVALVTGFNYLLRISDGRKLVRASLWTVILIAVTVNVLGSVKNSAIALTRVRTWDLADFNTLVFQLKAKGVTSVSLMPTFDLAWSLVDYALHQAGIGVTYNIEAGRPLITSEATSFTPMSPRDIILRSPKGKYALSLTPTTLVEIYGTTTTSTEVRNDVPFKWMASFYDYNIYHIEPYFRQLAGYLNTLPGSPPVYNDLSDSGYYLLVEHLMREYSVSYSDDPRNCLYFVRLNQNVQRTVQKMEETGSAVINTVDYRAGKAKVVDHAFADSPSAKRVWQNDLFEVVFIPRPSRHLQPPPGLDTAGLVSFIRNRHLAVIDDIPSTEHERVYLEEEFAAGNIPFVPTLDQAAASLLCLPDFMMDEEARKDPTFTRAMLWRSSAEFASEQGYSIALIARPVADRLRIEARPDHWGLPGRPLRTLLWSLREPELRVKVHRTTGDLRLILETGPSLQGESMLLRVLRPDGRAAPLFFTIDAPSDIISIPLDHFADSHEHDLDLWIEGDLRFTKRVMPYDDRLLIYRFEGCELVAKDEPKYTQSAKRILRGDWLSVARPSPNSDILDGSAYPALALGVGWFQREVDGQSSFRWMSDHAEIVFEGDNPIQRRMLVTGEVGPSANGGRISIVTQLNGVPVAYNSLSYSSGKAQFVIDLDSPTAQRARRTGQNIIQFSTRGGGRHISGDPRLLNFRVFHIAFGDGSPSAKAEKPPHVQNWRHNGN